MSDKYELSRRKALAALGTIGVAGAGAGMGTSALFSDEESFENNLIQAGTTNLIVNLGLVAVNSSAPNSALDINFEEGETREADGEVRTGIQVGDMKPGDEICLGIDVVVEDNPMYVAVEANDVVDAEGEDPEPEPQPGSDTSGGELDDNLVVSAFGYEDGDPNNGIESGDIDGPSDIADEEGFSAPVDWSSFDFSSSGLLYRNYSEENIPGHGDDAPTKIGDNGNADTDRVTHYVCVALPDTVGNEVQGDEYGFDLVWSAEQVRNNAEPSSASDVLDGSPN